MHVGGRLEGRGEAASPDRPDWSVRHVVPHVSVAVLVVVLATACSALQSDAATSMHTHAANAATVLEKQPQTARATDAVRLVIGDGMDDTITVLAASGTVGKGFIELRIDVSVKPTSEFDKGSRASGCFTYVLAYFTHPDQVDCPGHGPMVLPPPSPVTTTTVS
jgi:hypothetical protein